MRLEIVLAPDAAKALQKLPAHIRGEVRDALERHLRFEPTKTSKRGIKRLRGLLQPQYRLRVNDIRVFYDVTETSVEILAIIAGGQPVVTEVILSRPNTINELLSVVNLAMI